MILPLLMDTETWCNVKEDYVAKPIITNSDFDLHWIPHNFVLRKSPYYFPYECVVSIYLKLTKVTNGPIKS